MATWGVIPQNYEIDHGATWGDNTANRSNNLQAGSNWEKTPPSGNWGTDRASAPTPSENNLNPKRDAQGSWGPKNKSENSYINRNEAVQVDQSTWQESAILESGYKKIKRESEEESLDVGIQHSFDSIRKNDDYSRQQAILDEEDDYDPNYSSSSKSQLGKSPYDDKRQFNTSDVYKVNSRVESSNSTFQEPNKRFRDVEVQTLPIDITRLIESDEKLLSVTISGLGPSKSATNNVSENRFPPQQTSLLDIDSELDTKSNSWNTSGNPNFRGGTAVKPDTNSRGEATQWGNFPKQNSDSWDSNTTSVQNDNWNTASSRNDNRGSAPQSIPQTSARNDNRVQSIPVEPDYWESPVSQSKPQPSARNDNRGTVPQSIPVEPDDWESPVSQSKPQPSAQNDNRGTVPQSIPVEPDDWESPASQSKPQTSARNDSRGIIPQPIPVEPDSWDSPVTQKPVQNDRGSAFQPNPNWSSTPQPTQNNSWNSQQQSRPKDTIPQEGPKGSGTVQQRLNNEAKEWGASANQSAQQAGDTWDTATNGNSDWRKQAEMFEKELGNSENKTGQTSNTEQKAEDSYGTGASESYYDNPYNDNSSSNNRYGSRGCHNCGQEGHLVRDCPEKKQGRSCHNCGKEGHMARECTEENSKSGYGGGLSCHKCGKEGHFARECPEESSKGRACHKCGKEGHFARECPEESSRSGYGGGRTCHKCGKDGHIARDCKEDAYETTGEDSSYGNNSGLPRPHTKPSPFSNPEPPNISSQEAWEKVLKADEEHDADDFGKALELYAKATPEETFVSIEGRLRAANCNGRIIALERTEIPLTKILVDLQGNPNKKYVARPIMCHPSRLPRTSGNRASSEQENLEWLVDSGFMVDDNTPICFNCKQKGHTAKECTEPKRETERQQPSHMTCSHCHSPDHQSKYCPEERRDYYAEARDRKFAGSYKGEYSANEDRAASGYDENDRKGYRGYGNNSSNLTCHNCNREGHISRECPESKRGGGGYDGEDDRRGYRGHNNSNQICRNCNVEGHISRDCPENRRGGRKCNKCGEEGHMSRECTSGSGGGYDRGNYNSNSGWQRDSSRNNDSQDNTRNKERSGNTALEPQENLWSKPSGGDSSRGDYNNTQNKSENSTHDNDNIRDSSVLTPNKSEDTSRQKDDQPAITVEKDSWDAPLKTDNAVGQNDWGFKTAEDFGWENSENKKSAPEDHENRQGSHEQRERASGNYENRRGYGNDQRERSYENRRVRGDDQRERSYDNRRGHGNDQRERPENYDNYDNRRGRGNDQRERPENYDNYEHRRGRGNDQRERSENYDNYDNRRGRGNDQRERSENYDNRRGRGNDQRERSEIYDNRRGRGNDQRERSENYDNRRGRGNEPRERTNEKYNNYDRYSNSSRTQSNDANNQKHNLDEQRPWW